MIHIHKCTLIFIAILLSACSAYKPPQKYDFDKERVYSKSFDDTWQKTIEWFASQGTPIKNMDKSSGFISTEYNLDASNSVPVMDCGKAGSVGIMGTWTLVDPVGNFNILIKKIDDNKTKVTVNAFFKAKQKVRLLDREPSYEPINCNSTGILELELLNFIGK